MADGTAPYAEKVGDTQHFFKSQFHGKITYKNKESSSKNNTPQPQNEWIIWLCLNLWTDGNICLRIKIKKRIWNIEVMGLYRDYRLMILRNQYNQMNKRKKRKKKVKSRKNNYRKC